jgi:hypothetical protein
MSTKFKKGDLVELLPVPSPMEWSPGIRAGMIGTIDHYEGDARYINQNVIVRRSWVVEFCDSSSRYICEDFLKLVPGNPDCKDVGKWDDCPWNPYKVTEPKVLDKVIEGEEA